MFGRDDNNPTPTNDQPGAPTDAPSNDQPTTVLPGTGNYMDELAKEPVADLPQPATPSEPDEQDAPAPADNGRPAAASQGSGDLIDIKQQALQALSPLLNHLDQTPEERFRTTMMMIQASDNQALIPAAYEAAQGISDEKVRAQALLDIVNEINYFTQNQAS